MAHFYTWPAAIYPCALRSGGPDTHVSGPFALFAAIPRPSGRQTLNPHLLRRTPRRPSGAGTPSGLWTAWREWRT